MIVIYRVEKEFEYLDLDEVNKFFIFFFSIIFAPVAFPIWTVYISAIFLSNLLINHKRKKIK
jgi:hypothetical protein